VKKSIFWLVDMEQPLKIWKRYCLAKTHWVSLFIYQEQCFSTFFIPQPIMTIAIYYSWTTSI